MQSSYGILICKMRLVAPFALEFLIVDVNIVLYVDLVPLHVFKHGKI